MEELESRFQTTTSTPFLIEPISTYGEYLALQLVKRYSNPLPALNALLNKDHDFFNLELATGNMAMEAVVWGRTEVLRSLIRRGCDLNSEETYLHHQLATGKTPNASQILQILVDNGENVC